MSNVVSPRGPLPPKVYWRRRLVALAAVVGIVLLIGQLFGGGDGSEAVAERDRAEATPAAPSPTQKQARARATPSPTTGPTTGPTAGPTTGRPDAERRAGQPARAETVEESPSAALSGPTGPLANPEGECEPSEVVIAPDVEDTDASAAVPLRLGLSASGDRACTFEFGPDSVALQVTSGDDEIWQSVSCPRALEQQAVVVRPGWLTYLEVDWSGRRSSEGCGETGEFAAAGYYWAEAAALGAEPHRSQFELETPPPPKPTKKPAPQQDEQDRGGSEPASEEPGEAAQDDGGTADDRGEEQPGQGDDAGTEDAQRR
jgi:hypothetical protein